MEGKKGNDTIFLSLTSQHGQGFGTFTKRKDQDYETGGVKYLYIYIYIDFIVLM